MKHEPVARRGLAAEPDLRRRFGLDLEEGAWFAHLRVLSEPVAGAARQRIGSYELLGQIGRGGQGIVFKALQPGTRRVIVLKRLSAGAFATAQMRARFEREIRAAAALKHPNIVTVFGSEVIDGQTVLAMEWIDGVPLDRWADGGETEFRESTSPGAGGRRDVRQVVSTLIQVCSAVEHAHGHGIIHRDLKPSNILVDADGDPHVLDFGLAKLTGEAIGRHSSDDSGCAASLTATDALVGTPTYAAPEQFDGSGSDVTVRTDIHALGAILHRTLREVFFSTLLATSRRGSPASASLIRNLPPRAIHALRGRSTRS